MSVCPKHPRRRLRLSESGWLRFAKPHAVGLFILALILAGVPTRGVDQSSPTDAPQVHRPPSFRLDIMPVFARAGCNSGGCHGSASGQDGFRLSLFGFDPQGDYHRITREIAARRIDLALPAESLLLQKATGKVPHTGGRRFSEDSAYYQTLLRWIEAGAPNDPPDVALPVSLELLPKQMILQGEGATQQLTAVARYSDGSQRDVTSLAVFLTNNDNSAKISADGLITAAKRGEAFVMARFDAFTVGSEVIVVPSESTFTFPAVPEFNYIDTAVHNKLRKLRIAPAELCSDDVFLRRAYLDIVGLLPTRQEHESFLADSDANKRQKLIDRLLSRKEFVEMWVMKWAELLQIRSDNRVSYKSMLRYYDWLSEKIAGNVPFDQVVRELIGSTGGTFKDPAVNYYQVENDALKLAENTAQVFMGMRVQCAQCHNHPFDRWKMDDYYGFAAFFTQISRKPAEDPREVVISNSGSGEAKHPVGGQAVPPKFLGGVAPDLGGGKDRRKVLADWIASPDNPYFAPNLANIVWAHFLGRGIVDPVDDVRISNPPANAELLDILGKQFVEYNYDLRRLVRDICASRTYQLATKPGAGGEDDQRNFSHATVRRLRAEVLLDCITQATETKNKFPGLPLGARAVQIADGRTSNYFLTTFGRATRQTVCSTEVSTEPTLSQALHLINGETLHAKINQGGVVKRMLEQKIPANQIVEDLYLRCLTRKPTAEELSKLEAQLAEVGAEQQKVLEDLFWALLNSQEFMFNH